MQSSKSLCNPVNPVNPVKTPKPHDTRNPTRRRRNRYARIGECNRRMKDLDEQRLRPVGHGGIADGITESLERLVDDVEGKVATASAAVEALG